MKFWAQCKVPSEFMLLSQPSGVLTRGMLVALINKSECSSGFKIIKLYLALTHLSTWVFLVPMVSQGPMTPTCGFFLSRIKKRGWRRHALAKSETHHFRSLVRSGHMTATEARVMGNGSTGMAPHVPVTIGCYGRGVEISAPRGAMLRRYWARDQAVGFIVVKTTLQIHISFLSAFSRALADPAPFGTWL